MKRESIAFLLSGTLFGLIVGWMLGSQQAPGSRARPARAAGAEADAAAPDGATAPRTVDAARVDELRAAAQRDPSDVAPRAALGNLFFDAERFGEAITWYERALELDPNDVDLSTDLGVSYYYTNQPDRALQQFDHSLQIDPQHTKTILNMGIVRAFGKRDLAGAVNAWERVIQIAPESPEGRAAAQAIKSLQAAHAGTTATDGDPPGDGAT